ncbi:MAG: hypothetical protein ACQEQS_08100 [Thermodesulfobacteriota bacterium]
MLDGKGFSVSEKEIYLILKREGFSRLPRRAREEKQTSHITTNLDFTTIPYWGDDNHLENNWSGKRRQSLSSMLTVLAHDPDSGIIDYGDTDILHIILSIMQNYATQKYSWAEGKSLTFEGMTIS